METNIWHYCQYFCRNINKYFENITCKVEVRFQFFILLVLELRIILENVCEPLLDIYWVLWIERSKYYLYFMFHLINDSSA